MRANSFARAHEEKKEMKREAVRLRLEADLSEIET